MLRICFVKCLLVNLYDVWLLRLLIRETDKIKRILGCIFCKFNWYVYELMVELGFWGLG